MVPRSLKENACKAKRTAFNFSRTSRSIKSPWLSNLGGGWYAFKKNSGLFMKWRSRNTPIWRRWYCDLAPPEPPLELTIAAALFPHTFGGLDAQSSAFFSGAINITTKSNWHQMKKLIFMARFDYLWIIYHKMSSVSNNKDTFTTKSRLGWLVFVV